MRQSVFWQPGDSSMHFQMEQRTALQNGGSRFHSRNRSRSGDCIGIHASGIWCKPQKNPAPGRERSQTSGRVLQRDFSCDHLVVSPIILSAFVYNVNAYINGYLFSDILGRRGGDAAQIGILYAEYATYFMTIINIPLTLSSTAPTSMIPEVSALYATGDIEATRECIDQTVQLSMVVSAPCAMGLAVLAQPIVFLLYGNSTGLAANLLILGSFSILLNGMSNISNGVLQAIGQQRIPVITAAIALVVDIVVVVVLLFTTNLGVYALLIAMVIYSVVVCVLNDRAMKKYLQYKNPWKEGYLYPVLASVPMGIVAGCICYGLNIFVKSNFICLIVSIPVAAVVYLFAYLIISKPSESQLRRIPGGSYLIRIAEKLPFWQNN